jgi:hypothetical protein
MEDELMAGKDLSWAETTASTNRFGAGRHVWRLKSVCCVTVVLAGLALPTPVAGVSFDWTDVGGAGFLSGDWTDGDHWNGAVGFPDGPDDQANISNAEDFYTVTLDADIHVGMFTFNSPTATFEASGRVFRVDTQNNFLQGVVNWDNSQILDSGAGTFNQNIPFNLKGNDNIVSVNIFNQNGTMTLQADSSFNGIVTVFNSFTNFGTINLNTSTNNVTRLTLNSGTLTNSGGGVINFGDSGAGLREFEASLINNGAVNLNQSATFSKNSGSYTNNNAFNIATGKALAISGDSQVFNQDGGTLDIQGSFNPISITFNYNAGEMTGNAMLLTDSNVNIAPAAGNGAFIMQGNSNTFSGDLAAGQFLTARADASNNGYIVSAAGFSNDSTLSLNTSTNNAARLTVTSGALTNNAGGIISFGGGGAGLRDFVASLINNGIVNVNQNASFSKNSGSYTNNNAFNIRANKALTITGSSQVFNQDGGTLDVQGSFNLTSITFNYNGGEITGIAMPLTESNLTIAPAAGNGVFVMRGNSNTFSGDLATGQFLTARADSSFNGLVTSATGFSNDGVLSLNTSTNNTARLTVTSGTLTNSANGFISIGGGGAGLRNLVANLINDGTVNLNRSATFNKSGGSYTNSGTISFKASGANLTVTTGTFTNDPNGVVEGIGTMTIGAGASFLNRGSFSPGLSAGILQFVGNYDNSDTAQLVIEIGGTAVGSTYDRLAVSGSGAADLAGDLVVRQLNSFVPDPNDLFIIMTTTGGYSGSFDNAANGQRFDMADGTGSFVVHYGLGSVFNSLYVVLSDFITNAVCGDAGHPIMAGDLTEDCQIDLVDFAELSAGWSDIYFFPNLVDMATNWLVCNHPVSCP